MNRTLARTGTALGCTLALVFGVDYVSMAATGQSLLLGKLNSANATTQVRNTGSGPVLALNVKSTSTAPFTTNGKGKVTNLYADRAALADRATNATNSGHATAADDSATLNGYAVSDVATLGMTWGRFNATTMTYSEPGDVTMSHPSTGVFCIAVSGISHDSGQLVATADYDSDTTQVGTLVPQAVVEVDSSAKDCATGSFEVVTLQQVPTDLYNQIDQSLGFVDQGFSFTVVGLPPASVNAFSVTPPKKVANLRTRPLKVAK